MCSFNSWRDGIKTRIGNPSQGYFLKLVFNLFSKYTFEKSGCKHLSQKHVFLWVTNSVLKSSFSP